MLNYPILLWGLPLKGEDCSQVAYFFGTTARMGKYS
ncbi:MAG: hypothetical protein RIS29_845 [Bacteroidota bacterium]|jgi:hypothetical protein